MVGVILLADGFHFHISKVYLYFALFFASGIEALNVMAAKNREKYLNKK
jgi:predicted tellurium resistance membrane protein TerC